MPKSYINTYIYTPVFPKPLSALQKENFVVNPVSNSAISLCASSTELTYPKLSARLPSSKGSRFKILAMLFLFVPQESWDLQLLMFGYITRGFPRIFGYVLQVIKYSISVPLDRGGFGGWNLILTDRFAVRHVECTKEKDWWQICLDYRSVMVDSYSMAEIFEIVVHLLAITIWQNIMI